MLEILDYTDVGKNTLFSPYKPIKHSMRNV